MLVSSQTVIFFETQHNLKSQTLKQFFPFFPQELPIDMAVAYLSNSIKQA